MSTVDITVYIFNDLSANFLELTCTNVYRLNFRSGYIAFFIGSFHVVVDQLIAVVTDVCIVGAADLLGRNYIHNSRVCIVLPWYTVDIRSEISHLGIIGYPFTNL